MGLCMRDLLGARIGCNDRVEELCQANGGLASLDISTYAAGKNPVQIRFVYSCANWCWWAALDNIHVYGY